MNRLKALAACGQSVWLDYIRRDLITSGELARLIREDGVSGVTSNPAIFEKAIAGGGHYAQAMGAPSLAEASTENVYEALAIRDIRMAADALTGVYRATARRDGYVSLEVSPHLAHDTGGTILAAQRLWETVGRDNLMIKVPATPQGISAIEKLLTVGINVNATLIFSLAMYTEVAHAHLRALEQRRKLGEKLGTVASVASFFVSRIDTQVDKLIAARLKGAGGAAAERLRTLMGRVAIANARIAYRMFKSHTAGERWQALAERGAMPQRLLWASTGTKDPAYRDVRYVEELIGPDTVNTLPPATLDAFRDHGEARPSLEEDISGAQQVLDALERDGISLDAVTSRLLDEGVRLFAEAYDSLLAAVARERVLA